MWKAPRPEVCHGQKVLNAANRLFCIHFSTADLVMHQKVIHAEDLYVNLLVNTWENWIQVSVEV